MNETPTHMLGRRYAVTAGRPEIADAPVTHGVDTLSGHEVALTRVVLPETLTTDSVPDALATGAQDAAQPEEPVLTARDAVRALTYLPDHPHLAQIFDVLIEDETLWIVSERIVARPLSALLSRKTLTAFRAAELAREILRALRHLHIRGWLHRNITADTVLISDDGHVLIDGLAQSVAEEALCGFRPRPLPHPRDDEAAPRTPLNQRESSSEPVVQTQMAWTGLPAGFTPARGGGGSAALRADAQRQTAAPSCSAHPTTAEQDRDCPAPASGNAVDDFSGPVTTLEARRARDARIARIGAVTERWAPEQAAPVNDQWQLAPPVGPAVDLWALGVLLFRMLQGHPPYPEEDIDELVVMVCAEPPAFAEDCGQMRAVIESLLRQDPAQRLSIDEAERWLVSLLRDVPEPAPVSEPVEEPARRLPVLRFRGHLVRRRPAPASMRPGRHRRTRRPQRPGRRTLLIVAMLPLALGVLVYAAFALARTAPADAPDASTTSRPSSSRRTDPPAMSAPPSGRSSADAPLLDPAGFQLSVGAGWKRHPEPDRARVLFTRGDLTLIVVPGRDSVDGHPDPLDYQKAEPELAAYRADPDGTADGVRRIDIGADRSLAEGQYTYTDAAGTLLYTRNLALVIGDRYHVVFVQAPSSQSESVTRVFNQAVASYQASSTRSRASQSTW